MTWLFVIALFVAAGNSVLVATLARQLKKAHRRIDFAHARIDAANRRAAGLP